MEIVRQHPGPHKSVDAGIKKRLLVDAVWAEFAKPTAIDLHVADIPAAVPVTVDRPMVAIGFDHGNRLQ